MARLRKADCSGPGIRRRRRGKRFEYFHDSGRKIKDPEVLDRIAQLRIPPAWEEGWWRGLRGENDSYGLATMREEHVTVERSGAVALAVSGEASQSTNARKRAMTRAVKEVAGYLGNTPAVCRASYIDPRVFDRFQGGLTIGGALPALVDEVEADKGCLQGTVEEAVIDLIAEDVRFPALEKVA